MFCLFAYLLALFVGWGFFPYRENPHVCWSEEAHEGDKLPRSELAHLPIRGDDNCVYQQPFLKSFRFRRKDTVINFEIENNFS